jgi:hypothetical protein
MHGVQLLVEQDLSSSSVNEYETVDAALRSSQPSASPDVIDHVDSMVRSFLFPLVCSTAPNDALCARGQMVRDQNTVRDWYEWTPMFVSIFPAFDGAMASRACEVVRRQRRKTLLLQSGTGESSYSVSNRGHHISYDSPFVAAGCPLRCTATNVCLHQLEHLSCQFSLC